MDRRWRACETRHPRHPVYVCIRRWTGGPRSERSIVKVLTSTTVWHQTCLSRVQEEFRNDATCGESVGGPLFDDNNRLRRPPRYIDGRHRANLPCIRMRRRPRLRDSRWARRRYVYLRDQMRCGRGLPSELEMQPSASHSRFDPERLHRRVASSSRLLCFTGARVHPCERLSNGEGDCARSIPWWSNRHFRDRGGGFRTPVTGVTSFFGMPVTSWFRCSSFFPVSPQVVAGGPIGWWNGVVGVV